MEELINMAGKNILCFPLRIQHEIAIKWEFFIILCIARALMSIF